MAAYKNKEEAVRKIIISTVLNSGVDILNKSFEEIKFLYGKIKNLGRITSFLKKNNVEILGLNEKQIFEEFGKINKINKIKNLVKRLEANGFECKDLSEIDIQNLYSCMMRENQNKHQTNKNMSKTKEYILPNGGIVYLQGFEPAVLDHLFKCGYKENEIVLEKSKMPKILYEENGKIRRYYPDFYIPKYNQLIEVKSAYVFQKFKQNALLKFRASKKLGFNITIIMPGKKK